MKRTCNIGAKGKLLRFTLGLGSVFTGILLISLYNFNIIISEYTLTMGIMAITGGSFAIWEAKEGWCLVRAIGIKTPF